MNIYLKGSIDRSSTGHPSWNQRLSYVILLFAILIYLGNTYRYHSERWDDAHISFRFAQHVEDGLGLVWNVGGERVEGYTSLLHILLLAFGIKIGIPPYLGSLIIGVASVLATFGMLVMIVKRQLGSVHPVAAILLGLYLLDRRTAIHSASGMETHLFIVFLCAGYFAALLFIASPGKQIAAWMALTVFLSVLCRPEGVLYAFALYGSLTFYCMHPSLGFENKKKRLLRLAGSACLIILLGMLYALWKWKYFGYILPNSYYLKSGRISLKGLIPVLGFLAHFVIWYAPLTLCFVFLLPKEALMTLLGKVKPQAKVLLTLAPPALALAYYVTIIHEMGMSYRFSYPCYFYLVLAVTIFTSMSVHSIQATKKLRTRSIVITMTWPLILIILQGSWQISPLPPGEFTQYHSQIARALNETGLGARGKILCDAAGIIPYISGFSHVDRMGLTDNFLSGRELITPEEREKYLWTRQADVYVGYEPPATSGTRKPQDDPGMDTSYVSHVLMNRKLTLIEDRIFVQDPLLLHSRMRELRDNWYFVGELEWPGWKIWNLKSFIYVRKSSLHSNVLLSELKKIISIEPDMVDLNNVDDRETHIYGLWRLPVRLIKNYWLKLI